jgi:hypothetical protein
VTLLVWASLAFFVVVLFGGLATLAVTGLRAWRTVRAVQREGTETIGRVMDAADKLTTNLDRMERKIRDLELAVAHLRRSLARAAVLVGAVQDIRAAVAGVQAFLPQK